MIWSSLARNRSLSPVVARCLGRIATLRCAANHGWTPRRIAKNEIARFRHLMTSHLAIPNPLPVPKPIPDQLPTSSSRATEYSLPFSYWVVSVLGNVFIIALLAVMAATFQGSDFNPYTLAGYVLLVWLLVIGWSVFHLVGVWRSATRYRHDKRSQNRSPFWGILAQIALILGGINLVSQVLKDGVPQLREIWRVAFENDPSI